MQKISNSQTVACIATNKNVTNKEKVLQYSVVLQPAFSSQTNYFLMELCQYVDIERL